MSQMPYVGIDVCFYGQADKRNGAVAAKVTEVGNEGAILKLSLFRPNYRELEPRVSVRHIDDPYLQTHPEWALEFGAWDYVDVPKPEKRQIPEDSRKKS